MNGPAIQNRENRSPKMDVENLFNDELLLGARKRHIIITLVPEPAY
jgi:hypothetical protein